MRKLMALVMIVVVLFGASMAHAGSPNTKAEDEFKRVLEKCTQTGTGFILCSVALNLMASCLWSLTDCKNRSNDGICWVHTTTYYAGYKKLIAQGWQGPILPFVCSYNGKTYLPDGRVLDAAPKGYDPFLLLK